MHGLKNIKEPHLFVVITKANSRFFKIYDSGTVRRRKTIPGH